MNEFETKQQRIRALLEEKNLDALVLQRVSSFAWATCGAASYVNTATTNGASSLLVTPTARYVITNNIEATRLEQEEQLTKQGWEFRIARWHEPSRAVAELTRGLRLGTDGPFSGATDLANEMARVRARLMPEEGERFRALGALCAQAMECAIHVVRPGQTENEIAARLAEETQSRGAQPIVNLVAADERVFAFRHPLPTNKKLERYAMLVLCGRKGGLVCSLTRFVHFGALPDELVRKSQAVARVDAEFIGRTRPQQTLAQVFQRAASVYAEMGFADEWRAHHQGGATGYESREYLGTPNSTDLVLEGQAFAWNPSIAGTKSEDTLLVSQEANEIITVINDWPTIPNRVDGQTILRPAILELT